VVVEAVALTQPLLATQETAGLVAVETEVMRQLEITERQILVVAVVAVDLQVLILDLLVAQAALAS
jgi:hypothetical protein